MAMVYCGEPVHPDVPGLVGGDGTNLNNLTKGVSAHFLVLKMVH